MLITVKVKNRSDAESLRKWIAQGVLEAMHDRDADILEWVADNLEWVHDWIHILEDVEAQMRDERNV